MRKFQLFIYWSKVWIVWSKGLFGKSYMHEIDLFQMILFEIDILETIPFGNTQKLIEIDFLKSMIENVSQISQEPRGMKI